MYGFNPAIAVPHFRYDFLTFTLNATDFISVLPNDPQRVYCLIAYVDFPAVGRALLSHQMLATGTPFFWLSDQQPLEYWWTKNGPLVTRELYAKGTVNPTNLYIETVRYDPT